MKRLILLMVFLLFAPEIAVAEDNRLIITGSGVNETITSKDFTYSYIDSLFVNQEKLQLLINRLADSVYQPAANASLDDSGKIIPGNTGYELDMYNFKQFFYKFFYNDVSFEMRVPLKAVYPKVDSELLNDIRTNQIGNYMTYYRPNNEERAHNIQLATEAINNYVVFPGETFSFNKVVGKRTEEKGYKKAPVIVKGELSEDIGGGICQVSSTLFNAVSLQGIDIVERYSHSRQVPYVPPGKDATVSWWGPDFVFKNDYSHPILIRAKAKDGRIVIRIYTSDSVTMQSKRDQPS